MQDTYEKSPTPRVRQATVHVHVATSPWRGALLSCDVNLCAPQALHQEWLTVQNHLHQSKLNDPKLLQIPFNCNGGVRSRPHMVSWHIFGQLRNTMERNGYLVVESS